MNVTFLVTVDEDSVDPNALLSHAGEIQDSLEGSGFAVVEVKPWSRQTFPTEQQQTTTGAPPVSGAL